MFICLRICIVWNDRSNVTMGRGGEVSISRGREMKLASTVLREETDGLLRKMAMKLLLDYMGKDKAHLRLDLFEYLQTFYPELKDRKMRKIYSEYFPIGHKREGIYHINDPKEFDKMIGIMKKKIDTYDRKIALFEAMKRELIRMQGERKRMEQMNLYRGN